MKPFIAISCRDVTDMPGVEDLSGARLSYLESIAAAGGVPVPIPLIEDITCLRQLFDICHALLVPGGEDVDPARYGETSKSYLGKVHPHRDTVELSLIEWARAAGKPILGICRGAQILNVAYGGTLYQDINEERPHLPRHRDTDWAGLDQTLEIEAGSRLHRILETNSIRMNSKHHQAVKEPGRGLRVCGVTDDGLIEAIESDDETFVLGVQCHPESLWKSAEPSWGRLFQAFIGAARERALRSNSEGD